jgi:4-carboxymuconolactone decarboxylase
MRQTSVRIPPVSAGALTDEQKALVGKWSSMNFATVTVTHPALYKVLMPLIAKVISGSNLPPRDREILVLRTLALCDEVYESHHHASIARNAGVTDSEIEQARSGRGADLSTFDQSLVRAAEELARDQFVSDKTWRELAQRYSPIELMEVVSVVGVYMLMAMLTKSCGIQLEDPETFNNFAKIRQYT